MNPFILSHVPRVHFGDDTFHQIPSLTRSYGDRVLLITGSSSLEKGGRLDTLISGFKALGCATRVEKISGEPNTKGIDAICARQRSFRCQVVVGIGGGSVVDAAKAISAILPHEASVADFLEGVGSESHNGIKVPFIAVPTTAGTGAEMTKNAVIKGDRDNPYKKSLRHDNLIPNQVVIDPNLAIGTPVHITAACGMDAFTQLLESYCSPQSNPITDALALSGLERFFKSLPLACQEKIDNSSIRADLAYGAMISGITLTNAGLGIVHGLAGPIGGALPIPHGVVCGTLLAEAIRFNIKALQSRDTGSSGLWKLAKVGFLAQPGSEASLNTGLRLLQNKLDEWTEEFPIPKLGVYGMTEKDLIEILPLAKNRANPVALTEEEIKTIVKRRL